MENEKQLEKALERYRIIVPLLKSGLEKTEKQELKKEITETEKVSEKTLNRYIKSYEKNSLEGLKPKIRKDKGKARNIKENVIEEAIKLKEELPTRSVATIIKILETEKVIEVNEVSQTTLNRQLKERGYNAQELRKEKQKPSKRFQRKHKGDLWQIDIKYGPYIVDPENEKKKKQIYLLAVIDDATRKIMHAEFYYNQRLPILEDSFRKSLIRYGIPSNVYVDNGKIFISKWYKVACARLKVNHIKTQIYSPASKGKIERVNRTFESFLEELKLEEIKTIKEINEKLNIWIEEYYHKRYHRGIKKTPNEAWEEDEKNLESITPEQCRGAFLWEETRKVDKAGCLSLKGVIYEAGIKYIGKKVELRYDPFDLELIELWEGCKKEKILKKLKIKEYNGIKNKRKVIETSKKSGSRLLKALEKDKKETKEKKHQAISYKKLGEQNDR